MIKKFLAWLMPAPVAVTPEPEPDEPPRPALKIRPEALARSKRLEDPNNPTRIAPYEPPRGVLPSDRKAELLAMDSVDYDYLNDAYVGAYFRGYPYLALLSQKPEYRKMSETVAKEMCRKWIRLTSKSGADIADKLSQIEAALERHNVRDLFRKAAELDGFFGRGQIYIDVKKTGTAIQARVDNDELKTPLPHDPAKIKPGDLIGFKIVEPVWTYPGVYNGDDPLSDDFYRPRSWFVMGREIHRSRMLTFVSREVPDLLKPSYNFGGLSLSQIAEPYVDNWIRTRDSVSDMLHSFSISGIMTNMTGTLSGDDGSGLDDRAQLFTNHRDNRGLFLLDKDTEDFFQYNVPLSGLDALQAQSQEQMASVSNIPLVKLLGITPSGLNASSEGEIRVFYDYIHSMQEHLFRDNLQSVLEIIQLDLFGEIDPDIGAEFEPLYQPDAVEASTIRKTDADTDAVLIGAGVISPDEARQRIASDPDSGYAAIETNELPDDPEQDDEGDD